MTDALAAGLPDLVLQEPLLDYRATDGIFMLTFSILGLALMGWLLKVTAQGWLVLAAKLAAAAVCPQLYPVSMLGCSLFCLSLFWHLLGCVR